MLAWISLLFLIAVEAIAIKWWLSRQLFPLFFSGWAAFLYCVLLALDIVVAWFISTFYHAGGTPGMQLLLVMGIGLVVIVGLGTIFFRWVVRLDLTDISKRDK